MSSSQGSTFSGGVAGTVDGQVGDLFRRMAEANTALRERSGWQLVHRHADPLAAGISLEQAAAIARGSRTTAGA